MHLSRITFVLLGLMLLVGCRDDDDMEDPVDMQIEELRMETADFVDYNAAVDAGWDEVISGCVEHPTEGAQGIHVARLEYLDATVDHLKPEVLMYEYNEEGEFEFLGVEYVVPFSSLPENEDPPVLFEQEFHKNHEQEIWALHVWSERENPNGIFADWNPNVSCEPWINMLIDEVREETAAYSDLDVAKQAGWDMGPSPCVEHPTDSTEGAQGVHFVRPEYMDSTVHHLEPEVLVYEPTGNGEMEFVAVEYVVPFQFVPETADPPILFNQAFHPVHEQDFWALHLWSEKDNPNGIFADWNPNVSCE